MKKYIKEIIVLLVQILMFYCFPMFMYLYEPIGMVMLMLLATFILSVIITIISKNKIKYLYSIVISIIFLPTVPIFYNESALVHSIWYLVISSIGLFIGFISNILIKFIYKK